MKTTLPSVLTIALLLLPACGRKTLPRPPELVMPRPIVSLAAQNNGEGIVLSWKRPTEYVDGSRMLDLAGFRVERAAADEAFAELATLEVTDRDRFRQIRNFRYLDQRVTPGTSYRYRVISFTSDGSFSDPSGAVEAVREIPSPTPADR